MDGREEEIKKYRLLGWTYTRIGAEFNVSKQRVHQICGSSSLPVRLTKDDLRKISQSEVILTKDDLATLLKGITDFQIANFFLYVLGFSLEEIAQRQKTSLDQVEESINKMTLVKLHVDTIAAIQEMFS
jgi:predicted DNA-binding protein YlxM (UPF0122 family)